MNAFGLTGTASVGEPWHVGHIQPNEIGTGRGGGEGGNEDMGWNLFAQEGTENIQLSDRVATSECLRFYSRGTPNYQPLIHCTSEDCLFRFDTNDQLNAHVAKKHAK